MGELPKKRYILRVDPLLSKGATGEKGDDGADGAGGSLPINTSDVIHDGTLRNGENLRDLVDELFYDPVVISNFRAPGGNIFEIGTVLTSLNVTWELNKDITGGSQVITGNSVVPPVPPLTDQSRSVVLTLTDMSATTTLTLTVSDANTLGFPDVQSTLTLNFWHSVYTGQAEDPGTITDQFLKNLNSEVQATRNTSFSTLAVPNEFAWIAFPISYGIPTFTGNGYTEDMIQHHGTGDPFSHTNDAGAVVDYYVFSSETHNQTVDYVVL
jgi:hypothetical protein